MSDGLDQSQNTYIQNWKKSLLWYAQKHPLRAYFILVFNLVWLWEFVFYGLMDYWGGYIYFMIVISPSVLGLIMITVSEGNWGINRLIARLTHWRVKIVWYLVGLLSAPVLFFITVFSMSDVAIAFQMPKPSFIWTYFSALVIGFFGPPIIEEIGWRGFALPRLQRRYGALLGTLILGSLWAFWHFPSWFLTSRAVIGSSLLETVVPFLKYECSILGSAFIYTWIYNRTNGSLFLSMLLHASINATFATFPNAFLPSLFQPHTFTYLFYQIGFLPLAILVIILTRGRLGYDQAEEHFASGSYLYGTNRNLEKAEKEFRQAIALEPQNCRYFLALALLLDDSKESAEAITYYEQAIKLDKDKKYADMAYLNSGILFHEKLNCLDKAERVYRNAIELSPANPEGYFRLGWLLHDGFHRYSEAEHLYLKAVELNPQDETALYNLACIKSVNRDSDSAFTYLRKAIEKGFDANWAKDDQDFEWLHNDSRFNEIVGSHLNTE